MYTVAETQEYINQANKLLDYGRREELVNYLSIYPDAGEIIPGTGGIRKLRWAASGRGKRGGVRIVYYFRNEYMPLFLLSAYAKNRVQDLSAQQRKKLVKLVKYLIAEYETR